MDLVTLEEVQGQFGLMMFNAQERSILISAYSEVGDSQIVTMVKTCPSGVTVS